MPRVIRSLPVRGKSLGASKVIAEIWGPYTYKISLHVITLVLIEAVRDLDAAITRVKELRESAPNSYLIVSEITGKKILFAANGAIKRN